MKVMIGSVSELAFEIQELGEVLQVLSIVQAVEEASLRQVSIWSTPGCLVFSV